MHFLSYYTFMYILLVAICFADQFSMLLSRMSVFVFIKNEWTDWSSWICAKFAGLV